MTDYIPGVWYSDADDPDDLTTYGYCPASDSDPMPWQSTASIEPLPWGEIPANLEVAYNPHLSTYTESSVSPQGVRDTLSNFSLKIQALEWRDRSNGFYYPTRCNELRGRYVDEYGSEWEYHDLGNHLCWLRRKSDDTPGWNRIPTDNTDDKLPIAVRYVGALDE